MKTRNKSTTRRLLDSLALALGFACIMANGAETEITVTLAQGLPNTKHTLEISGSEATPIAVLRVYRPALRGN